MNRPVHDGAHVLERPRSLDRSATPGNRAAGARSTVTPGSPEKTSGATVRARRAQLRDGVRIRVHASPDVDRIEIPLDFILHLALEDAEDLAIRVELLKGAPAPSEPRDGVAALTRRERAVIELVATGNETAEIARVLHISPATVRTHVRNAMEKVGARTRAQLVALVLTRPAPTDAKPTAGERRT